MVEKFLSEADYLYESSVKAVSKALPSISRRSKRSLFIEKRISKFGKTRGKIIDYEKDALAFNQAYFFKNLYKCFVCLTYLKGKVDLHNHDIIDIGSGVGTFSLAFSKVITDNQVSYKLIDSSSKQLGLSKYILRQGDVELDNRLFFGAESEDYNGIRLASYWFCEQNIDTLTSNGSLREGLIGNGLIIVDYPAVVQKVIDRVNSNKNMISFSLKLKVKNNIKSILEEEEIRVHGAIIFKG